ncbi:MAG: hypothetical protein K6U74_02730 [Firmicutes bacterium]|nr:hypothetical protein [Bacillota bacterium]
MPKKLKTFYIVLAATCLFLMASYITWSALASGPPLRTAESYVRALAGGDAGTALKLSTGTAAWAASRLKESDVSVKIESVKCSVVASSRSWARVTVAVELTLRDGSADVGWYSLDVTKTGQEWKVVSFHEAEPDLSGVSLLVKQADVEAAKQAFQQYLDALTTGDMQSAAKHLAGPARKAQEMGAAVLGKGAVVGKVEGLKAEPAWERGKEMAVRFDYSIDGRSVSVLSTFYRTTQGWKIVKVVQN